MNVVVVENAPMYSGTTEYKGHSVNVITIDGENTIEVRKNVDGGEEFYLIRSKDVADIYFHN